MSEEIGRPNLGGWLLGLTPVPLALVLALWAFNHLGELL